MNNFDSSVIKALHHFSENSHRVNDFIYFISENDFIKGCVVVSVIWFFWFQSSDNGNIIVRKKIINTLLSSIIAISIGLLLVQVFPYRTRPLVNPDSSSFFPFPLSTAPWFGKMSSMPSDHAVLFSAFAMGIFLISKKIGLLTFLYACLFIFLPRVYLGYHHPTDILAGMALGIIVTLLFSIRAISDPISNRVVAFSYKHSGIFYLLFFWICFQIATVFSSSHTILSYVRDVIFHNA